MSRTIELTGKYQGERFRFDNADGSSVIIGDIRLANGSKELAKSANVDPDGVVTIKGDATEGELSIGTTYRFLGTWRDYWNRNQARNEKQFAFRTFVPHIPHDKEGVIDYLAAAGRGKGIGPAKARAIVNELGVEDALLVCRTKPEKVALLAGIRKDQADRFSEVLKSQQAVENATLEVDRLLSGRGFPKTLTRRVIREWGNRAAEIIDEDPYALMQFRGVGFLLADKLYIQLGKDPVNVDRQALCMWYAMSSDQSGNTWYRGEEIVNKLHQMVGRNVDYRAAIVRGKEYGQLTDRHYGAIASIRTNDDDICDEGGQFWLAEGKYAAAEKYISQAIAKAMSETSITRATKYETVQMTETMIRQHVCCQRCYRQLTAPTVYVIEGKPYGPTCVKHINGWQGEAEEVTRDEWMASNPIVQRWYEQHPTKVIDLPSISLWPDPANIEGITDHQREELAKATIGRIGCFGGSPGTGKTYVLAAMIKAIHATGRVGLHEIGIGAPTGKAAVRLSESLSKHGVNIKARTWHSLLGIGKSSEISNDGDATFQHNEDKPWQFKVILGDETSMPPVNIMAAIFKARRQGTHMLFVGDVNQLAPVGNGAPFRDMILAGLPYGELREILRNDGGIVYACSLIRDQKPWTHLFTDRTKSNLWITNDRTPEQQIKRMVDRIREEESNGLDPTWDIQVLTAVNQRSELSRENLNKILQDMLNPNEKIKGTPFREADKVVCLKNGYFKSLYQVDLNDPDYDATDDGEVYVANGELGRIESISEKTIQIRLENPERVIEIFRGKPASDDEGNKSSGVQWDLGYALSGHKFQGSEQKIVLTMLDPYSGARRICDRSWIFTQISRAQIQQTLIGTEDTANRMCKILNIDNRKTMLAKLIKLELLKIESEGL